MERIASKFLQAPRLSCGRGCGLKVKRRPYKLNGPKEDILGTRYGKLFVVDMLPGRYKGNIRYLCKCDCSKWHITTKGILKYKGRSCGCSKRADNSELTMWRREIKEFRRQAHSRKIEVTLTDAQIKETMSQDCTYCLSTPSEKFTKLVRNGIDRIRNEDGYILGNVTPSCFNCNRMKYTMSQHDFLTHVAKIQTAGTKCAA